MVLSDSENPVPDAIYAVLRWGARLAIAAGVLFPVSLLVAWVASGQQVAMADLWVTLAYGSLLLTWPLLIALPPYLLHRWPLAAWLSSLACSALLILVFVGLVTATRPDPPPLQLSWYSWETLIVSLRLFGALLTVVAIISFWNRPQGVAAVTILTGVIAYQLASMLDGYYSDPWRLVVVLAFSGSWVWLGLSVEGMWPE